MHLVKCVYCQKTFDRDVLPTAVVSARRYAHQECFNQANADKTKAELEYNELIMYIKKILKDQYVEAKVAKQIMDFKKQYNYTFSGMLKTLQWWYEIKSNPIDKANGGIGIIPFVYNEAYNYFKMIYDAQQRAAAGLSNYKTKIEEVVIPPPQIINRSPRLFEIEEEVNDD